MQSRENNLSKAMLAETKKKKKSFESSRDACYTVVFVSVSNILFSFAAIVLELPVISARQRSI